MDRAKKVLAAAALLVKLHSQKASEVARQWSKDLTERNDAEAAAVCLEIADAAAELLTKSAASEVREPALSDILSGAVTREVMRGDHVKPSDVKRLMTKAKRRRSRSTMKWDHPTEPRRQLAAPIGDWRGPRSSLREGHAGDCSSDYPAPEVWEICDV